MNKIFKDKIPVILLYVLPLIGVIVSCYHAVNIPLLDDYNFVFGFLENYLNADSLSGKMNAVFEPSNRMIFATFNLIVLLDFTLFGGVDFIHFIFLNNLLHLVLLFVLYRIFQQEQISTRYFIPVALLFAAPNFAVQNWACYTAHVLAVLLSLMTIWTINRQGKKYFWWALLMAIIAASSAGGGFLAFLAPIPILFTRHQLRDRLIWGAFFTATFFVYVYWSTTDIQEFVMTKRNPIVMMTYALNFGLFFGSVFKSLYQEYHIWAGIFGVIICCIFATIFLRRFARLKMHPLLTSGLIFALLLAALITFTRSQYGIGATTAYRYRLYQFVPLVFIYLYVLIDQAQFAQKYFWSMVGFSLLFFGFRMQYNLNKLHEQNWQLESGLRNFVITGAFDQLSYHTPAKAGHWLRQMSQNKVFDLDQKVGPGGPALNLNRAVNLQSMQLILDSVIDTTQYCQIKGWAFPSYSASESLKIYLLVEAGGQRYYYLSGPLLDSRELMSRASGGFVGLIDKAKLDFDWNEARVGVALQDPFRGIIAERFLP